MKKFIVLILIVFCNIFQLRSQITSSHQSIASFKVSYKAVTQTTGTVAPLMQGVSQATLSIKPNVNVSKVYFKILDKISNAIIYQSNYMINSAAVINEEEKKLFENNNGSIFISNGQPLIIKPYLYQLQTEDDQSNLSPIYSSIQ